MYHHGLCTTSQENVLSVSFHFLLRSSLKTCPSGCLYLVIRFIDCFTVDDPVYCIDKLLYVECGGVSLFQIFVIVILVLLTEGVYVCPHNIFQLCVLCLISDCHFIMIYLQFFVPGYFL